MRYPMLGRTGRVVRWLVGGHGGEGRENLVDGGGWMAQTTQTGGELRGLGLNNDSTGRKATGITVLAANQTLPGDVDQEIIPAEEIRPQYRVLNIRKEKGVHYT